MNAAKLLLIAAGLLVVGSGGSLMPASNIDPVNKHSWSENTGWMNWKDALGGLAGVEVTPTFLLGWIWDENVGWINVGNGAGPYANTSGLDFGVNLLLNGDLDGYAWSENKGWLNFGWAASTANPDRARYDAAAKRFRGWVWGENIGWVNLDAAAHYVAVTCITDDDCNDFNACTCDRCVGGACTKTSRLYGDVNCDAVINIFDIFCQLDLISTGGTSTMPGCNFSNADIDPCTGNAVISIFDIFAVLDAIAGIDPCCGRFAPAACCVGSTCSVVLQATCDTAGGLMVPGVASCTPHPCPLPPPPEAVAPSEAH